MDVWDASTHGIHLPGRFIDFFGAKLFVPEGHFDESHLLAGGTPESHVVGAFARFVKSGDVVVDVGANIGTHAFALASLVTEKGKVFAVEANLDNILYLRRSIAETGSKNIVVLPFGASNEPSLLSAKATIATNNQYCASEDGVMAGSVAAFPLDAFIREPMSLVKIDIEGAELLALQGLSNAIDTSRPVVLSEFSPAYIEQALGRDRSLEFFKFFDDRNYQCFHLDPYGFLHHKLDYEELIAAHKAGLELFSWHHLDLLFVPAERPMPEQRTKPLPARDYLIQPFLLRKPIFADVPWRFEEPSLASPVCQLCTYEQMVSPDYALLCESLGLDPATKHRKAWEFVYILAALRQRGKLAPGYRGLGFGTGHEPLPSCFAGAGACVVATDAPQELIGSDAWAQSQQWTRSLDELWLPNLVSRADFQERVTFRPVDMNAIPHDLRGFDFCWSACCLEHLGSIRHGLDFIRNSLATLKPGGVAVHTTEFNVGSETDTYESSILVLFRKGDIELVLHELIQDGHEVEPLNLWPGATAIDQHIDVPPYTSAHVKIDVAQHVTTSFGLIVTKR